MQVVSRSPCSHSSTSPSMEMMAMSLMNKIKTIKVISKSAKVQTRTCSQTLHFPLAIWCKECSKTWELHMVPIQMDRSIMTEMTWELPILKITSRLLMRMEAIIRRIMGRRSLVLEPTWPRCWHHTCKASTRHQATIQTATSTLMCKCLSSADKFWVQLAI